ncbi:MAG: PAS domain S-box protein [Chloroflexi bacterium]|nr:PAS domain S-box protein [Chloroflexota bacterium]
MNDDSERFRLLAERSPDVVYRFRLEPTVGFEYVSPAVFGLLGWTPDELYADPSIVYGLVFPEDLDQVREMFEGRFAPDEVRVLRWRRRDGTPIWTEQRWTPHIEDGRTVAIEGTARDITERIDAHERLRRSEERLRAMLDRVDILAVAIDRDGSITFANPWLCQLTGRTPEELLGRDWFETCVPEAERELAHSQWSTLVAGDPAAPRLDTGLRAADGGTRRITWSVAPIVDGAGQASGCVALGDDVTASREARALERRLSAAVEQTAESVVIADVDGRILYVNPAFERVSGYGRAEVIGQTPRVLQSGLQDERFYAQMWGTLTAGETWTGELVNRARDGRTYIEEASITPIRDGAGAIINYVAVKRDVTHERLVEASLAASREERLQVARLVAGFEPAGSPEATGAAIVAAVAGLPDIDAAWIVTFDPDGVAVILAATPAPFPADHLGHVVPRERAAGLRAEAAGDAWAAMWTRQPGEGTFYDDSVRAGITATAAAPIGNGSPIAVLRVGSTGADGAERLERHLPALQEFAAAARTLLEPALRARHEAAISRARFLTIIDEGTFSPVFQPIVNLDDGAIVGFESLTRFTDGTRPDLVFADARSVDLGLELEIACLRASIEAAEALPAGPWLSLNLSPRVVLSNGRLRTVLDLRSRPTVLELTEHERVDDYAALRSAIVKLGPDLRIAVDDAGAGVANFSHLVELRPDFVKIDIGLVRGVNADLTRQALVVGLRHFAQATDRDVIAEGIETEAERRTLRSLGVNLGQGFLFGHPAPAADWGNREPDAQPARRAGRRASSRG